MVTTIFSHQDWDKLLEESFKTIKELSILKGGEYSGDTDRLLNFRRNAKNLGIDMELVWAVYAAKHWDAIMQYIKDITNKKSRTRLEPIAGRIDDLIVYLLLLKAMIKEPTTNPNYSNLGINNYSNLRIHNPFINGEAKN